MGGQRLRTQVAIDLSGVAAVRREFGETPELPNLLDEVADPASRLGGINRGNVAALH